LPNLFARTYAIIILLLFATSETGFAADNNVSPPTNTQLTDLKTTSVELNRDYFNGYVMDTKSILTSPARWSQSDWWEASLVTGIAVGLYTQDDKIQTWVRKHETPTTQNMADDVKKLGALSIPILMGLGGYGYVYSDDKAKTTFLLSTESFIITGAFVQVLKFSTGRHRPYTEDPHDTWSGFSTKGENHSFPSGDASSAFAVATVVASEYDNMIVPPLVYGLSTLIALERVHNNDHWSSDVFIGSAIGYFTGKAVIASHSKQSNLSFMPLIDGKDRGVLMSYRF
jgi:hypothetical protein